VGVRQLIIDRHAAFRTTFSAGSQIKAAPGAEIRRDSTCPAAPKIETPHQYSRQNQGDNEDDPIRNPDSAPRQHFFAAAAVAVVEGGLNHKANGYRSRQRRTRRRGPRKLLKTDSTCIRPAAPSPSPPNALLRLVELSIFQTVVIHWRFLILDKCRRHADIGKWRARIGAAGSPVAGAPRCRERFQKNAPAAQCGLMQPPIGNLHDVDRVVASHPKRGDCATQKQRCDGNDGEKDG
jgi:hypothetical protein